MTRRLHIWLAMLALLLPLLAACGNSSGGDADGGQSNPTVPAAQPTDPPAASQPTVATEPTAAKDGGPEPAGSSVPEGSGPSNLSGKLEIFSWWTNGGEADGLNAMYDVFKKQNPNVEIVNATVAGGAGTNAKTVLVTRMQGGQPPDSFQVHAGQELIGTWVAANKMEPLNSIFEQEGWNKVMPKLLLEQISQDGQIYSVPVNIHRSNMLWYNKEVFTKNNLTPPKTIEEFYQVADKLKAAGVTPLAVGGKDKFEAPHLFESVLLATFGPDDYAKLWAPGSDMWSSDPRTKQAVTTLSKMLTYANTDRASLSWSDAAQRVLDGKAGMTIMGDWAEGFFLSKKAKPNVEFGWAPSPGTDGVFMWLSDSFGLPEGAPHRDNAIAWLKLAGSKAGQDAFNPKKGSIPARTDADKSLYDEYLKYSIDRFASDKLAPSVVHGAAANETYMSEYGNLLNVFSADQDQDALNQGLTDSADQLEP